MAPARRDPATSTPPSMSGRDRRHAAHRSV